VYSVLTLTRNWPSIRNPKPYHLSPPLSLFHLQTAFNPREKKKKIKKPQAEKIEQEARASLEQSDLILQPFLWTSVSFSLLDVVSTDIDIDDIRVFKSPYSDESIYEQIAKDSESGKVLLLFFRPPFSPASSMP
jgi:hypothetical protein